MWLTNTGRHAKATREWNNVKYKNNGCAVYESVVECATHLELTLFLGLFGSLFFLLFVLSFVF